jgi:predicted small secreted protein
MKTALKTTALLLVLLLGSSALTACHTVKGVGKDVERAGEEIQDASGKKN